MKYAITISREFGCGAREIARKVASDMGITLYDKALIDETARKAGVHVDLIKESDEKAGRFMKEFSYGSSTTFYSETAFAAQAEVIREAANKESCVLFGRCADYILREYNNCINIFLYAPLEYRIQHISTEYGLDVKSAEKMIKKIDRQRHNYYKYVTGKNRGARDGKHLMIDVGFYGIDGTVELIGKAVRQKFNLSD